MWNKQQAFNQNMYNYLFSVHQASHHLRWASGAGMGREPQAQSLIGRAHSPHAAVGPPELVSGLVSARARVWLLRSARPHDMRAAVASSFRPSFSP